LIPFLACLTVFGLVSFIVSFFGSGFFASFGFSVVSLISLGFSSFVHTYMIS